VTVRKVHTNIHLKFEVTNSYYSKFFYFFFYFPFVIPCILMRTKSNLETLEPEKFYRNEYACTEAINYEFLFSFDIIK